MMVIGVLTAKLAIYGASLKDKRRVLRSVKDRIRREFNVSIAETDAQDAHLSAVLTAAVVSNERVSAQRHLQQVLTVLSDNRGSSLVEYTLEML